MRRPTARPADAATGCGSPISSAMAVRDPQAYGRIRLCINSTNRTPFRSTRRPARSAAGVARPVRAGRGRPGCRSVAGRCVTSAEIDRGEVDPAEHGDRPGEGVPLRRSPRRHRSRLRSPTWGSSSGPMHIARGRAASSAAASGERPAPGRRPERRRCLRASSSEPGSRPARPGRSLGRPDHQHRADLLTVVRSSSSYGSQKTSALPGRRRPPGAAWPAPAVTRRPAPDPSQHPAIPASAGQRAGGVRRHRVRDRVGADQQRCPGRQVLGERQRRD